MLRKRIGMSGADASSFEPSYGIIGKNCDSLSSLVGCKVAPGTFKAIAFPEIFLVPGSGYLVAHERLEFPE